MTSDWWEDEYSEEVHGYLLKRELSCVDFQMKSPLLPFRHVLLEYMNEISKLFEFCKQVKHLAMYYLDLFLDNYSIQTNHLQLVVMGCLIVAAKAEENSVPRMSDFNALVGNIYELHSFVYMEVFIMKFLEWKLLVPTAAVFADYYGFHAVTKDDYHCDLPLESFNEAKEYITQYIDYFLELSLQHASFRFFRPSVVAASCVASARICLFLSPVWPETLHKITTHNLDSLKCCLELMIRILYDVDIVTSSKAHEMLDCIYEDSEQTYCRDPCCALNLPSQDSCSSR